MAGGPVVCVTPLPSAVVVRCPPSAPEPLLVFRSTLAHFLVRSVYVLGGCFDGCPRSGLDAARWGRQRRWVGTRRRCWTGFPRIQSDGPSWSVPVVSSRRRSTPIRRRVGRLVGPRPHSVSRRRCRALPSARPTRRLREHGLRDAHSKPLASWAYRAPGELRIRPTYLRLREAHGASREEDRPVRGRPRGTQV